MNRNLIIFVLILLSVWTVLCRHTFLETNLPFYVRHCTGTSCYIWGETTSSVSLSSHFPNFRPTHIYKYIHAYIHTHIYIYIWARSELENKEVCIKIEHLPFDTQKLIYFLLWHDIISLYESVTLWVYQICTGLGPSVHNNSLFHF
jgi:hypothetical protein